VEQFKMPVLKKRNKKPNEIALAPISLVISGEEQTRTLQEWCHHFDIAYVNARMRYSRGKRGMDIFQVRSEKPLEQHIRHRYNEKLGIPRTVRQYFEIPAKHRARFDHHKTRLGLDDAEMIEGMFEMMLKRLDKHEAQRQTEPSA